MRVVELLKAATGVGVLFIVIGYIPAVYSAFSRRETAVAHAGVGGTWSETSGRGRRIIRIV